jgi:hypothetical protein
VHPGWMSFGDRGDRTEGCCFRSLRTQQRAYGRRRSSPSRFLRTSRCTDDGRCEAGRTG